MMLTTKGRYAILAIADIAQHSEEINVTLDNIATRQGLSKKILETVMPALVREGHLISKHGRSGGYRLTKQPKEYFLLNIVLTFQDEDAPSGNKKPCPKLSKQPCAATKLDTLINSSLKALTIADLLVS